MIELSSNTGVGGENERLSTQEKVYQVLKKAFLNSKSHSKSSGLEIVSSPHQRSVMRSKLNQMGSALTRMNSKQGKQLFERWEKSDWVLTLKCFYSSSTREYEKEGYYNCSKENY